MARIMMLEDNKIMAECIVRAVNFDVQPQHQIRHFSNAIEAMVAVDELVPDLIILDVMLPGPDGFSFLNELTSYSDTAKIPVLIITSLDLASVDLRHYGVRKILQKETMTPQEIHESVQAILADTVSVVSFDGGQNNAVAGACPAGSGVSS